MTDIDDIPKDLLALPDGEIWKKKADVCQVLYQRGLEFKPWSDDRAQWWSKSLIYFVEEFIQPRLPIPDFHRQWYWLAVREKNLLNLAPRDHAKTSVHTIFRTVWEICVNRNIRYFIIMATQELARLALNEIKSNLVQNERIKAGFGIFNPAELPANQRTVDADWTHDSITVNRSDYSLKDPTVAIAGSTKQVLSRRVDRLVEDDIVDDKIAFSAAESERLVRWEASDVQPILASDGQHIVTGTLYSKRDYYHGIMEQSIEKGGVWRVVVSDAIIDEAKKIVLWKDRWSWDDLVERRAKQGRIRFNRNYRNIIIDDSGSPFPMIWFEGGVSESGVMYKGCYDDRYVLGQPNHRGSKWLRFSVLGVDPAIGQTRESKYFAAVLLGLTYDNDIVIAEIVRGQFGFVAQKRIVIDLYEQWRPRYVAVESNAYQKALVEGIEEQYRGMPISTVFSTPGAKSKPDIGVPAMDIWFETGRIRIPRGNQRSIDMTDALVEELHLWGKGNTSDIVMALWFAFKKAEPELQRSAALPAMDNLIFGDRWVRQQELVMGLSGMYIPAGVLSNVRRAAMQAPLAHLSPLRKSGSLMGGLNNLQRQGKEMVH